MAGALEGVRILDLSWGVAGPLGVLLLAEQGADVIKVEPPGGDPFRSYPGYKVWTRSRRSVTCDLKSEAGRAAFDRLAGSADVLVETYRPGVMERLGVGYEEMHARHPRLIYMSCPAYPPNHRLADRPGYDQLVAAASGQQWEQPGWRMGPIFLPLPTPSMGAIYLVPMGILAALLAREETGRGQHVETSLLAGAFLYTTQIWQWLETGDGPHNTMMAKTYPPGIHQPMIFETADGWVHVSVMSGKTPLKTMDEIIGLDDPPDPMTFPMLPPEERERFTRARRDAFGKWKTAELVAELRANNHAVEEIVPPERQFEHEQLKANDMVVTVDDPDLGKTTQIGVPIHLLGTPGEIQGPQPRAGAHDEAIWGEELGFADDDITAITGRVGV